MNSIESTRKENRRARINMKEISKYDEENIEAILGGIGLVIIFILFISAIGGFV